MSLTPDKIKVGISACLLGRQVRYDGGHKLDRFITATLGKYLDFVPVCPEAECGLGVPREVMRLVGDPEQPRLVTVHSQRDLTDTMTQWAEQRLADLEKADLDGFIFKSASPSSGMERVKVYDATGMPIKKGVGIFARLFMARFPLLPVEDEGRLHDPELRENFLERLFTLHRWRQSLSQGSNRGMLVEFHTRHKYLIMAHSPKHLRLLGKLVAIIKELPLDEACNRYQTLLLEALRLKATIKKNIDVLLHLLGYFKKSLSPPEKVELLELIDNYRQEYIPLIVPITLLNHYVRKYNQTYLLDQFYLHPHPLELKLRNHA